jgi:hypothetical protein
MSFGPVGAAGMRTADLRLHTFRGVLHAAGTSLWYEAVVWLPLATMAALGFTGPIFVTVGAVLFLRETVHRRRWAAVGVGFAGMLVIVRPGLVALNPGILMMLLAVPLLAGSHLVGKVVAGRDDPAVVVLWQSVVGALCLTPLGIWFLADADLASAWPVRGGRLLRHDGLRLHHLGLPAARHLRPATHHLPRHRVGRLDGRGALGQDLGHLDLRRRGDHRGRHDVHRPSRSKGGRMGVNARRSSCRR